MTHRTRLLAGAAMAPALAFLLAATPVAAQLLAVATPAGSEKAIAALMDQANYWRQQNRPDQVARALDRVLAVDPRNPEALANAAQAQAQLGNRAAADALVARLRAVAPADPRLQEADVAVRVAGTDQAALLEARRLAQAGRGAEAVAQYRALFRGPTPPASYAQEFYATLAGTEGGYEEARAGLARLVEQAPGEARLQLAYAEVLTYRAATRAEGIARLRRLASGNATSGAATNAWRQALLWAGPNPAMVPELEAFLARNPNDAAITQRLEEIRAPQPAGPPDAAAAARQRGFDLLNTNRARDAGRDFEAAIAANPEDADAIGGLGVVRLREGRYGEARSLLERAIRLDPAKRAQWQKALDGAGYAADLASGRSQLQAGDLNGAEQSLRRALSRDAADRADAEALLGDIALRRGDYAGAETRYRAALARRPSLAGATSGLYEVLQQQGRFAEAEALQGQLRQAGNAAGRASQLRAEALRANDPEDQMVRLREALSLDPGSPWIRLDLARLLARQGQQMEARALMGALEAAGGAEGLHAAALFAEEDGRPNDATAYLNRIPARQRTADMNRELVRSRVAAEVENAVANWRMGARAEARVALVALAARPDPTGSAGALAVRALGTLGDAQGAAEAGRAAISVNAAAPATARLAIAGALLTAGAEREAVQVARSVESQPNLSAEDRRQAAALQAGFAIRSADRLNEQGNQAAAYEALAPVLGRDPTNPAANLALARLYQGARQPDQAAQVAEAVLRGDPRSLDARMAALDAAIAQRDWSRAEALLVEARAFSPNDPRVPLMEAKIARAGGNSGRALRALERAQEQLRSQGKVMQVAATTGTMPGNPFRGAASGGAAVAALPGGDPVANEVARELASVREEASSRIQGALAMRFRSGTAGLDRLSDVSAPVSASLPLGTIGGRLSATMTPVTISSGQLDNGNLSTLRSFGSNMLQGSLYQPTGQAAGPSQAVRDRYTPRDDSATGVGLGLAYTRNAFAADVGTTPLGFREQNIIGGVEIAPALSNTLKLRVTGERRAMTDSMLSWAGMRDTNSGRTWGGVVRTGGRAQLEIGTQPISFYVGGGYSSLDGSHVAKNNRVEAGAGASWVVYREPDEELIAGMDLVYFAYDKNQRLFSYGNGGYFSPQSYVAALFPLDWRARSGNLAWRLGGTIGYQTYRENAAKYFPLDAGLQAQADLAAASDATLRSTLPSSSNSGISGGVRGDIEYSVTPNLRLGALLRYDRTANWNEARGLVYARYRFAN